MTNEKLCDKIKRLRVDKGFKQEELANKIDMSTRWISQIEQGHGGMKLETLQKICDVFDENIFNMLDCTEFGEISWKEVNSPLVEALKTLDMECNENDLKDFSLKISVINRIRQNFELLLTKSFKLNDYVGLEMLEETEGTSIDEKLIFQRLNLLNSIIKDCNELVYLEIQQRAVKNNYEE